MTIVTQQIICLWFGHYKGKYILSLSEIQLTLSIVRVNGAKPICETKKLKIERFQLLLSRAGLNHGGAAAVTDGSQSTTSIKCE